MNGSSIAWTISTLSSPAVIHRDEDLAESLWADAAELNALDPDAVQLAIRDWFLAETIRMPGRDRFVKGKRTPCLFDDQEHAARWLMVCAVHAQERLSAPVLLALAKGTSTEETPWAFQRLFPPASFSSMLYLPSTARAMRVALEELDKEAETGRLGDALVALIRCVDGALGAKMKPGRSAQGTDWARAFDGADATFQSTLNRLGDAIEKEATPRTSAWFEGLWDVFRKGWIRVLPRSAETLHRLCPDPASAAAAADRLQSETKTLRATSGFKRVYVSVLVRAGRAEQILELAPQELAAVVHAYVASDRRADALAFLNSRPQKKQRDALFESLGESPPAAAPSKTPLSIDELIRKSIEEVACGATGTGTLRKAFFHPSTLQHLLTTNRELSPKLAFTLAKRAVDLISNPRVVWAEQDVATVTAVDVVKTATSLAPTDAARVTYQKRLAKRLSKKAEKSRSHFVRELMYAMLDELPADSLE